MNARKSRANWLKPYGDIKPEDADDIPKRPAFSFSSWIGGGVNYWLLIVAIVLLIVIFGAPIVYRMLDQSKTGEGPGAGSPAQEAISHGHRGKISEKIVNKQKTEDKNTDTVTPAETPDSEGHEVALLDKEGVGDPTPTGKSAENNAGIAADEFKKSSVVKESHQAGTETKGESSGSSRVGILEKTDSDILDENEDTTNGKSQRRASLPEKSETISTEKPEVSSQSSLEKPPSLIEEGPQIKENAQPDSKPEKQSNDVRYVVVDMGNVRDAPSIKAKVKFKISHGKAVTVTEEKGGWYAIELDDGRSGWAYQTLLSRISPPPKNDEPITDEDFVKKIRAIRPVITSENQTGVIFELNGYHPPLTNVLDGEKPRLVCDFLNTRINGDIPRYRELERGSVQRIRIGIHHEPQPKIRVVLDFRPGQDYSVEQVFYKKDNYYTLIIKPRK